MNASFVVSGILTIVGATLLQPLWPAGRIATAGVTLWVLAGLGKIVVGLVPENATANQMLSIAVRHAAPSLAITDMAIALLGLIGTVLSTAGQFSTPLYLGLGGGGTERLAGFPGNLWTLIIGVLVLTTARHSAAARNPT